MGTKLKANASKHKAVSYARMTDREKELEKEVEKLQGFARRTERRRRLLP